MKVYNYIKYLGYVNSLYLVAIFFFAIGLLFPLFVGDSESIMVGISSGVTVMTVVTMKLSGSYPRFNDSKLMFTLPMTRKQIVFGWYFSQVLMISSILLAYLLGQSFGSLLFASTGYSPLRPVYIVQLYFMCVTVINVLLPLNLTEPTDRLRRIADKLLLVGALFFAITYNLIYYSLQSKKPYVLSLFWFTAALLLISTVSALIELYRKLPKIEVP